MRRIKPAEGNKTFCMAPWTHTYMSPQLERRLCCASLEKSTNFKQYIDRDGPLSKELKLQSLDEHWNSEYMRGVRLKLLAGEEIPQCATCNHKLLNAQVYRQHFNRFYRDEIDNAFESTDDTGSTTMKVVSWDYRFSNLCNFTCRMCGDMLSSSWEAENKKHGRADVYEKYKLWGRKDIKEQLQKFHDQQVVKEFMEAIENKTIKEFYWCGGEPLMWKIHWEAMQRVVDLGYANRVYARYNSNMSRIDFFGKNLFDDCLKHFQDWQINASIDGTDEIGEYIRTGLNYKQWYSNMKYAKKFTKHPRQLQLDLTVTLPGLFDLENMYRLQQDLKIPLLCKKVFTFTPDTYMSPLFMPKDLLHSIVEKVQNKLVNEKKNILNLAFFEGLEDLKNHPTNDEKYSQTICEDGWKKGKAECERIDKIRGTDIKKILAKEPEVLKWWNGI
jgi:organic radical activating enzyme